jgi:2-oxoglutarate dehydrogenase E2 component (dihydrolipoamide succinyltransferase)
MKTAAALLATSLTVLALSSAAPAQTGGTTTAPATPAPAAPATPAPAAKPATTAAPKTAAPKLKTVMGEVVSVDATAKTVTVKHTVSGKSEDMTFGAGEKASAALGTLKAGDHVRVAYAEVDGKPVASTIAKVKK